MSETRRDFLTHTGAALAGLAAVAAAGRALGASPTPAADGELNPSKEIKLNRYVIEREVPGIGLSTAMQLCTAAATSNKALGQLGPAIQWEHSYVADNKTFCVYLAENEELIRKHSELSGFPANKITPIDVIIDPTTANPPRA